nr:hypothetical protein [uncultured Devosia sp.]
MWEYFQALRRLVQQVSATADDGERRQFTALAVMMSVTIVEAFLNVYFRVVVSESEFIEHRERILADLESRKQIGLKLKEWPSAVFGRGVPPDAPAAVAFRSVRERRNALMHFTSSHSSFDGPGFGIEGLADTQVYDDLGPDEAANALQAAEGIMREIFLARGIPVHRLPGMMHAWTGVPR